MWRAEPFQLSVGAAELAALRGKLQGARLPGPQRVNAGGAPGLASSGKAALGEGWALGCDAGVLRELVAEWAGPFLDAWPALEAQLNGELPQFTMELPGGFVLHYIHARCGKHDAVPVVMLHGWPSTLYDFRHVVPQLVARGFDVVVPALVGFGFSRGPRPVGVREMAELVNALMVKGLGYQHYAAQGGDWGAGVGAFLAAFHGPSCVALHSNMPMPNVRPSLHPLNVNKLLRLAAHAAAPGLTLDAREAHAFRRLKDTLVQSGAYFQQHVLKPDTLGLGLQDSPAGLLAYVAEKYYFNSWEPRRLTAQLLTTCTVLYASRSVAASLRLYREIVLNKEMQALPHYIDCPSAFLCCAGEVVQMPRALTELCYDVRQYSVLDHGGHFAPVEVPAELADDVSRFLTEAVSFDACVQAAHKRTNAMPADKHLRYAAPLLPLALGAITAVVMAARL
jgi:pimeloyl-ACP methyl ester carboxylesterase